MSNYEPGTVAKVTNAGKEMLAFRVGWPSPDWMSADVGTLHAITDVRPLVVLDLPDGAKAGWPVVVQALREARVKTGYFMIFDGLIDQIEQQTRPPKPPEPGRYGVVVAGDGREWIRFTTSERSGYDWCRPGTDAGGTEYARWDDLDVLRIVREGVERDD